MALVCLLKFDREHQRFIRYRNTIHTDPDSLPQNINVESLIVDREGASGLVWAEWGPPTFDTIPAVYTALSLILIVRKIQRLNPLWVRYTEDSQKTLWIWYPAALSNRIDRGGGRYSYYRLTAGPADGTDVIAIGEDRSGGLWVGTYLMATGTASFRPANGTIPYVPAQSRRITYSLSSDIVFHLLVDHNREALGRTTSGGLSRFDAATERFITYKLLINRATIFLPAIGRRPRGNSCGSDRSSQVCSASTQRLANSPSICMI